MKKETLTLGIIVCVVVTIAGIVALRQARPLPPPEQLQKANVQEKRLSNFALQDYQGRTVFIEDFKGKPLVINTWASWCPFCVKELPEFADVQKKYKDSIVFIAINRGESADTAKDFTDKAGVTEDMVFLLDPSDSFYRSIEGFSMPETIFVDTAGVIREHKRGPLTREEIEEKVKKLIQ